MRGSGCFTFARPRFSGRTVVVVRTPGLLCTGVQTPSLQTLTNGLCETTAIDIYLISPRPSAVSTMWRLTITLWGYCFFFFFSKCRYGWCQGGPCCSPLLKAHPLVPRGRGERGRGEKVKLKAPGTAKKHTSLCFPLSTWWSIILTTRWRKERTCLFFILHS